MASPFFFVSKKDGWLRPTQDYQYLNQWTIKNAHPLPLISDIMDKIKASGAKYFTKFDIRWGYNNIRIKEGDQWKAAFKTNIGLFEPMVMFFGLCNSPATFQAMMNDILKDELNDGWVIVYMDDILIFSKTKEWLEEMTKWVLQKLRENDLYLKPGKCEFCKTWIEYLGLITEEGKMSMDPGKLNGIWEWPVPKNMKQVCSWLGFGNFYQKFIQGFSHLAQPLNQLLKKDQPFIWTDEAQWSFDNMKKCFTEEPVLMMPDQTKPFQIECDASKWASGAVLTQLDINGDQHSCAFISQTFSPTERNYKIYDRELLSMIRALQEWHHYIQRSNHETIIYLDHKNLTYFQTAQKLNHRQARWSLLLSEFDIKLIHLPGDKMILSDTLSQQPDFVPDKDTDNKDMILLPDKLFGSTSLTIHLIDTDLQWKIANSNDLDAEVVKAVELLIGQGPTNLQRDLEDWTTQEFEGKNIREGITFLKTMSFNRKSPLNFMTECQLDTQEKSKLLMQ